MNKLCKKCGRIRPIKYFGLLRTGRIRPQCRECHNLATRAYKMNQRAKEYGQRGRVSAEDLREVLRMYSGGCAACGKRTHILHVDHVKPLALGGKNSVSNMQPLCPQHNTAKGIHRYDYRKTPFILYEPKGGK